MKLGVLTLVDHYPDQMSATERYAQIVDEAVDNDVPLLLESLDLGLRDCIRQCLAPCACDRPDRIGPATRDSWAYV